MAKRNYKYRNRPYKTIFPDGSVMTATRVKGDGSINAKIKKFSNDLSGTPEIITINGWQVTLPSGLFAISSNNESYDIHVQERQTIDLRSLGG